MSDWVTSNRATLMKNAAATGRSRTTWRQGDLREDGFVFWGYSWRRLSNGSRKQYLVFRSPAAFEKLRANLKEHKKRAYAVNAEAKRAEGRERRAKNPAAAREKERRYYATNAAKEKEKARRHYARNAEVIREKRRRKYYQNREAEREASRQWAKGNRSKLSAYSRNRRKANKEVLLAHRVRERLRAFLKGRSKSSRTQQLVGCSWAELVSHIERQFSVGMSWSEPNSFHIDHIIPLAAFQLSDESEWSLACNWRNLRPVAPSHNSSKGARITEEALRIAKQIGGRTLEQRIQAQFMRGK